MTETHLPVETPRSEPARASADPSALPEAERLESLRKALDDLRRRVDAELGEADVRYIERMDRSARVAEIAGRTLIHVSLDPVTFTAGVLALWAGKQIKATEIGHTVLHGAFDRLEGAERFRSKDHDWGIPVDEASWRLAHNVRHHGGTNVGGRDPDIHFGPVRLTEQTPWHPRYRWQLPYTLLVAWPNFALAINLHVTGMLDLLEGNGRPERFDFIEKKDWPTTKHSAKRFLRKWAPNFAKEYLLFPALAGPFAPKVALGNWLSERMRDVYTAATIYCGHVGADIVSYPEGTRPGSRGEAYAMQVEASNDYEVPWLLSVFCGGLDRQIEHHLFPHLPTERLRQIAPEVRAICEAHGVRYTTGTWPEAVAKALGRIAELSRPTAADVETAEAA